MLHDFYCIYPQHTEWCRFLCMYTCMFNILLFNILRTCSQMGTLHVIQHDHASTYTQRRYTHTWQYTYTHLPMAPLFSVKADNLYTPQHIKGNAHAWYIARVYQQGAFHTIQCPIITVSMSALPLRKLTTTCVHLHLYVQHV